MLIIFNLLPIKTKRFEIKEISLNDVDLLLKQDMQRKDSKVFRRC